jgi:hypothetical protein
VQNDFKQNSQEYRLGQRQLKCLMKSVPKGKKKKKKLFVPASQEWGG